MILNKQNSEGRKDWPVIIFLGIYHLALIIGIPYYFIQKGLPSLPLMMITIFLYAITGLSVTVGYHRFYSHLTFKLNKFAEFLMISVSTLAAASTALKWSYDHRLHHRYVDTNRDPYSINKGFWWAHIIWVFYKRETWNKTVVKDLLKNKMVVFQDKHYFPLVMLSNAVVTLFVGWMLSDYLGAIIFSMFLRICFIHHSMYSINSLAHYYGSRPYSSEHTAVNNWFISFLTFGEGYHNFHHTFAHDYRNGVRWYQFDPSKMLIWFLQKVGLASSLKRVEMHQIYLKLIKEDERHLILGIQRREDFHPTKKEKLIKEVQAMSLALHEQITELSGQIREYNELKETLADHRGLTELSDMIRELNLQFSVAFKKWGDFCNREVKSRNYALSH